MGSHSLSDVPELSEFPEDDHKIGANGDASMLSWHYPLIALHAYCSLDLLINNINTPTKAHARRPLE
jgi:hypothetical protein